MMPSHMLTITPSLISLVDISWTGGQSTSRWLHCQNGGGSGPLESPQINSLPPPPPLARKRKREKKNPARGCLSPSWLCTKMTKDTRDSFYLCINFIKRKKCHCILHVCIIVLKPNQPELCYYNLAPHQHP